MRYRKGVVSAERYLFDPGSIEIANRFAPNDPSRAQTFVCWNPEGHGPMNMRLGIANSCDVYFYKISGGFDQDGEYVEGLTVDRIDLYGDQFGFGRIQGIELPLSRKETCRRVPGSDKHKASPGPPVTITIWVSARGI
ncbi:MAG: penicillin-binding transpeptidase domain-containing protein [Chloroflexota bacterium]